MHGGRRFQAEDNVVFVRARTDGSAELCLRQALSAKGFFHLWAQISTCDMLLCRTSFAVFMFMDGSNGFGDARVLSK